MCPSLSITKGHNCGSGHTMCPTPSIIWRHNSGHIARLDTPTLQALKGILTSKTLDTLTSWQTFQETDVFQETILCFCPKKRWSTFSISFSRGSKGQQLPKMRLNFCPKMCWSTFSILCLKSKMLSKILIKFPFSFWNFVQKNVGQICQFCVGGRSQYWTPMPT